MQRCICLRTIDSTLHLLSVVNMSGGIAAAWPLRMYLGEYAQHPTRPRDSHSEQARTIWTLNGLFINAVPNMFNSTSSNLYYIILSWKNTLRLLRRHDNGLHHGRPEVPAMGNSSVSRQGWRIHSHLPALCTNTRSSAESQSGCGREERRRRQAARCPISRRRTNVC